MNKLEHQDTTRDESDTGFRLRYIFYCAGMLLALLAVVSYSPQDWASLSGGISAPPLNWIGYLGARFSWSLLLWFGLGGYVLVMLFLLRSIRLLMPQPGRGRNFFLGTLLVMTGVLLLLALSPEPFAAIAQNLGLGRRDEPLLALSGGVIGQFFAAPPVGELPPGCLRGFIGAIGTMVTGWILVTAGGVILYVSDWHRLLCDYVLRPGAAVATGARRSLREWAESREYPDDEEPDEPPPPAQNRRRNLSAVLEAEADPEPIPAGKRRSRLAELFRLSEDEDKRDEPNEPDDDEDLDENDPDGDDVSGEDVPEEDEPRNDDRRSAAANPPPSPTVISPAPASPPPGGNRAAGIPGMTPPPPAVLPEVGVHVVRSGEKLRGELGDFVLPPITMLAQGANIVGESRDAIEHAQAMLQGTLDSFQIPGRVTGHISGPRVTRFEITLDPGINVKKIEQISDNIAMSLSATSVRVLAPIPGRSVVGIEVSNSKPEAVFMRSVMESERWKSGKAEIPIALGKDVSGESVILDLAKAPHMLIAGATGTGKSVCTNSLIVSLLFRFRPDQLRLIMVDPKIVEFDPYRKLPHLLTPIINESAKVPIALRWAANEMDKRYHILARAGVKKLSEFNSRPIPAEPETDLDGAPLPEKMPLLVIIIDELADLMMTEAKKDVETNITRIAQKGRAAGIHIIVATQRPSTNVITGVIKANLPTRLCFQVRSMVDSRVVLDTNGAEKLLGMGDMLFMSSSSMSIDRVQGAFVKDEDIKSIVKFVSDQAPQRFNDQVLAEPDGDENEEEIDEEYERIDPEDRADIAPLVKKYMRPDDDDTMRRALEVVILDRKASTSYLQRRLKIGYNRAAELVDQMEERGIVGPPSGSGNKRDILIFDGLEIGE